jgi:hypothetical protein
MPNCFSNRFTSFILKALLAEARHREGTDSMMLAKLIALNTRTL